MQVQIAHDAAETAHQDLRQVSKAKVAAGKLVQEEYDSDSSSAVAADAMAFKMKKKRGREGRMRRFTIIMGEKVRDNNGGVAMNGDESIGGGPNSYYND